MTEKFFDVSTYNLDISSFALRELTGEDEIAAEDRSSGSTFVFSEELIAQSIASVDGDPVQSPYVDWKKWSTRTRDFVRAAYHRLNAAKREEVEDFLKAAFADDADADADVVGASN